jgi:hypothetical protein
MPVGLFRSEADGCRSITELAPPFRSRAQSTRQMDISPISTSFPRRPSTGPQVRRKMTPGGPKGEKRPALMRPKPRSRISGRGTVGHGWGRLKAALTLNGRTSICGWECAGSPASQTRGAKDTQYFQIGTERFILGVLGPSAFGDPISESQATDRSTFCPMPGGRSQAASDSPLRPFCSDARGGH